MRRAAETSAFMTSHAFAPGGGGGFSRVSLLLLLLFCFFFLSSIPQDQASYWSVMLVGKPVWAIRTGVWEIKRGEQESMERWREWLYHSSMRYVTDCRTV